MLQDAHTVGFDAVADFAVPAGNAPVMVRLTLPAGSRGLYMDVDDLAFADKWGLPRNMKAGEAELLLPRNTSIRITGAELRPGIGQTPVPGGVLYLDAELVQP